MVHKSIEDPETLEVQNPLLHGWRLCYSPDIPRLNVHKDRVLVYRPTGGSKQPIADTTVRSEPFTLQKSHVNSITSSPFNGTSKRRKIDNDNLHNENTKTNNTGTPNLVVAQPSTIREPLQSVDDISSTRKSATIDATPFSSEHLATPPELDELNYTRRYHALSEEQKMVYNHIIVENKNVFFSGSAGTGKTVLLRALISKFQSVYPKEQIAITAPTGIAAVNIQGVTLHSFVRIGLGEKPASYYIKQYFKNRSHVVLLKQVKVLIVDEISMLEADLLDKIEYICRVVRGVANKPFGGIKIIFCGDFFQLPPVVKEGQSRMAFEAKCWNRVIDKVFILKTTFRQKDPEFIRILNEVRHGKLSKESGLVLRELSRKPTLKAGIEPLELHPLRKQVDDSNTSRLNQLPGELHTYEGVDMLKSQYYDNLLNHIMAPKTLRLKEDAQVMLIKNLSPTLVNGSMGRVVGFDNGTARFPIVSFANGEQRILKREDWILEDKGVTVASRSQVPLILAWAISIHKSQGQTMDNVKVNLSNSFEQGQVYVALSRATRMETLQVLGFHESAIKVHPRVLSFYERHQQA